MKNTRMHLTILAALCAAASAQATTTFDLSSAPGDLGVSHTYTVAGLSILVTAFPGSGTADLFGKTGGGDENGLGLTNDPSTDHEITPGSFIQLDLTNVLGNAPFTIVLGSTTNGEAWKIVQTNSAGTMSGASTVLTGGNEGGHGISPTNTYLDITATTGNILLTSLSVDDPVSAPEPSGVVLVAAGLLLVSIGRWRKNSRT